jgi:hypothetical protein
MARAQAAAAAADDDAAAADADADADADKAAAARTGGGGGRARPAAPRRRPGRTLVMPIDVGAVADGDVRAAHGVLAGSYAYHRMSVADAVAPGSPHSEWLAMTGPLYVHDFVAALAPRDPVEEALATQLAVANGRVMWLTTRLGQATEPADMARLSEAVDRASNTCRRLALAWQQLRGAAPPAAPAVVVQNSAAQQVVQVGPPTAPPPAPQPLPPTPTPTPPSPRPAQS